jgi:hypothetical protein
MSEKQSGAISWFNPTKGFGFITPDDGPEDVYVHMTAVKVSNSPALKARPCNCHDGPLFRRQLTSTVSPAFECWKREFV